jgi:molybdate transport system regulatory protein
MLSNRKHTCSAKIWIEHRGKPLIGPGGADILQGISEEKSISKTAEKLGMSYRYVWGHIQNIQETLGKPIVDTYKGGKVGGGGANLNELGRDLLVEYKLLESYLHEVLADAEYWEVIGLKISARNRLKGRVLAVEKDQIIGKVKIEIETPAVITAVITKEAMSAAPGLTSSLSFPWR